MRFPHVSQTTSSKYHCFLDCICVLSLSYFVIAVKIDQAKKWNIYWYVCFQFARCVYCLVLLKIKTFFDYTFLCCATCYSLLKPVGTSSTKKSKRCCKTKLCIRCSLLTMRHSRWTSFACCGTAFFYEDACALFACLFRLLQTKVTFDTMFSLILPNWKILFTFW